MENKIVIIGSGALASEVLMFLRSGLVKDIDISQVQGIHDSDEFRYETQRKLTYPFLGIEWLSSDELKALGKVGVILAIANTTHRIMMEKKLSLLNEECDFLNVVSNNIMIAPDLSLGKGNIIYPNCVFGPKVVVGDFNTFTTGSMVSHDVKIGSYNFFSTPTIGGETTIGDRNSFGLQCVVSPRLSIGSGNSLQTGLVVVRNINSDKILFSDRKIRQVNR